jgi:hypothetical protein
LKLRGTFMAGPGDASLGGAAWRLLVVQTGKRRGS